MEGKRKLLRIPDDMLDDYLAQIRVLEREKIEAQAKLERLASHESPTDNFDKLVLNVQNLVECVQSGDPEEECVLCCGRLSVVLTLQFDVVRKAKVTRYPLRGGVVHMLECADSRPVPGPHRPAHRSPGRLPLSGTVRPCRRHVRGTPGGMRTSRWIRRGDAYSLREASEPTVTASTPR